jgi:hypothetical protein
VAWVTPPTFVSGNVLTAAQLNILSGDLNTTASALASAAGQWFISTAANTLAARSIVTTAVATSETTSSSTFVGLTTPGPLWTLTTGLFALVMATVQMTNNTANGACASGIDVTGATTIAANDGDAIRSRGNGTAEELRATGVFMLALTAGSNTFNIRYKTNGTGTGAFSNRTLIVMAM